MLYVVEGDIEMSTVNEDDIHLIMRFSQEFLDLKNIDFVTIIFNPNMENVAGLVDEVDVGDLEVEINTSLSKRDFLATLIHEMVHVSQIGRGDLSLKCPSTWKGVEYNGPYYELPWEVEAHETEKSLVRLFLNRYEYA